MTKREVSIAIATAACAGYIVSGGVLGEDNRGTCSGGACGIANEPYGFGFGHGCKAVTEDHCGEAERVGDGERERTGTVVGGALVVGALVDDALVVDAHVADANADSARVNSALVAIKFAATASGASTAELRVACIISCSALSHSSSSRRAEQRPQRRRRRVVEYNRRYSRRRGCREWKCLRTRRYCNFTAQGSENIRAL